MAVNKNWTTYEVNIGWEEVSANDVFKDSIIFKLLEKKINYTNGQLEF